MNQAHLWRILHFIQQFKLWAERIRRWIQFVPPAGYAFGLPALLYLLMVVQVPRIAGPDLWPSPDAIEYAMLTDSLIHGQPPRLQLGALEYPSRYALVYPLCAAIPAKVIEWVTAWQHKDYSYLSRLYWISLIFGLTSVLLLVHVGSWLSGSRWSGMLAGLFWCTHPALLRWASTNMSETLLVTLWLTLLAMLRPWLGWRSPGEFHSSRALLLRGMALGLLAGLLAVAKAPYLYWAAVAAAVLAFEARHSRHWSSLIACLITGLLVAAGEIAWRSWAFGHPLANGYTYWYPEIYGFFLKTFNLRYLWRPLEMTGPGNFVYYAQLLLGHRGDFFAPAFALTGLLACGLLIICFRKHFRPVPLPRHVAGLLAGWILVMLVFCGLYFFQSDRFPLLFVPLLDLLPAWLIVSMYREGDRSPGARLRRYTWRVAAWGVAALLLGRQLDLVEIETPLHGPQPAVARAQELVPLLREVPSNAWLFTNYQLALVQRLRPVSDRTRTGTLYQHPLADKYFNGHAYQILHTLLRPAYSQAHAGATVGKSAPLRSLFDAQNQWALTAQQAAAPGPSYILLVEPPYFPTIHHYWLTQLLPRLTAHASLVPVRSTGDMTLYRVVPHPGT